MYDETLLSEMLLAFMDHFEPAEEKDVVREYTTQELYEMFQQFYPGDYTEADMATHLKKHFKVDFDPLTSLFVWQLKAKSPRPGNS